MRQPGFLHVCGSASRRQSNEDVSSGFQRLARPSPGEQACMSAALVRGSKQTNTNGRVDCCDLVVGRLHQMRHEASSKRLGAPPAAWCRTHVRRSCLTYSTRTPTVSRLHIAYQVPIPPDPQTRFCITGYEHCGLPPTRRS
jgi:hypothetical protein